MASEVSFLKLLTKTGYVSVFLPNLVRFSRVFMSLARLFNPMMETLIYDVKGRLVMLGKDATFVVDMKS